MKNVFYFTFVSYLFLAPFAFGKDGIKKLPDLDTYSSEEIKLLPRLRSRVKDGLTQQYMFQDKYLVRFLRGANWNVEDAERMMRDNFRYRKQYDIDNLIILPKNLTKYSARFPFHFTWAKDDRPTLVGALKDINVRHMSITGEVNRVRLYIFYALERAVWNVHLTANRTGREIIQGALVFNMAGFNLRNQACVACIPLWIELLDTYEKYYPQLGHTILIINTPRIFQNLFAVLKPLATSQTLNAVKLFSLDKSEWQPELLKLYSPDHLTLEFGGTAPPQRLYPLTQEHLAIQLGPSYDKVLKNKLDNT